MRGLLAFCFCLLPLSAVAEEIYFRFCSDAVLRLSPQPGADRLYRLDVQDGAAWSQFGEMRLDPEGRIVSRRIDGQGETVFTPHNCEKVPGICQYAEQAPDGTTQNMVRINGQEAGDDSGTWSYTIMTDDGVTSEVTVVGTVRYAADGLAAEERWTETKGFATGCATRLSDPPR
ncbi:MAG: hypothetical protein AAFR17_03350 [Pseudomonadota bacterium]